MANVSRINGARPVKHMSGAPWNGQLNRYVVVAGDTTPIFQGDPVKLVATTDTQGQTIIPGVPAIGGTQGVAKWVAGTDTGPIVGFAVGFSINPLNLNSPQYRPASTAMYVLVPDADDTIYEIQLNTSVTVPLTDVNLNATMTDAGGSTVTGQSGITGSGLATTATLPLKLMGLSQKVDNDTTSAGVRALVMINTQPYSGNTVGV